MSYPFLLCNDALQLTIYKGWITEDYVNFHVLSGNYNLLKTLIEKKTTF